MHKPLNAQKLYNLHKAIYGCTSRLTRRSRTTYAKTYMYAKAVQPTQSRLHCAKPYKSVRKICTIYEKRHTIAQPDCHKQLQTD